MDVLERPLFCLPHWVIAGEFNDLMIKAFSIECHGDYTQVFLLSEILIYHTLIL